MILLELPRRFVRFPVRNFFSRLIGNLVWRPRSKFHSDTLVHIIIITTTMRHVIAYYLGLNVLCVIYWSTGLVNARLEVRLAGDDGYKSVSSGLLQLTDTNKSSPDNGMWHTPFFPPLFSWHSLPRVLNVVCRELGFPDGAVFGAIDEGKMYRGYSSFNPRRLEDILCGGEEMGIDECFLRKWSHAEVGVKGYHPLWINCDDGRGGYEVVRSWESEGHLLFIKYAN